MTHPTFVRLCRRLALAAFACVVVDAHPFAAQEARADSLRLSGDRQPEGDYMIGVGDVLEVAVWDNQLISRTLPVRPDGKISLPLLHDVQAAGVSPRQLEESLNKGLASYVSNPLVSVIVREIHSFKVSVIGQVKTPGRFELTSPATVLDVLAMAGGLGEYADRGRIVILRRDRYTTKAIPFAYDKLSSGSWSRPQDNFLVQPDDIILVR